MIYRMLGFDEVACAVNNNQFGIVSNSTPTWMSILLCSGPEEFLDSCLNSGWGNTQHCSRADDVGVVCVNCKHNNTVQLLIIHVSVLSCYIHSFGDRHTI